jgi:hypothetical protein
MGFDRVNPPSEAEDLDEDDDPGVLLLTPRIERMIPLA